jgi:hypothetical protein
MKCEEREAFAMPFGEQVNEIASPEYLADTPSYDLSDAGSSDAFRQHRFRIGKGQPTRRRRATLRRPNSRRQTMSRIFITGSSTGLGRMAGELLASKGHKVVLHARNANRAEETRRALPQAEAVVIGDLETIAGAKDVATQINALGHFNAVIHNAAVGYREGHRVTSDGLPHVFAINTLSACILTALIERPERLVYLSSGMHHARRNRGAYKANRAWSCPCGQ